MSFSSLKSRKVAATFPSCIRQRCCYLLRAAYEWAVAVSFRRAPEQCSDAVVNTTAGSRSPAQLNKVAGTDLRDFGVEKRRWENVEVQDCFESLSHKKSMLNILKQNPLTCDSLLLFPSSESAIHFWYLSLRSVDKLLYNIVMFSVWNPSLNIKPLLELLNCYWTVIWMFYPGKKKCPKLCKTTFISTSFFKSTATAATKLSTFISAVADWLCWPLT